MTWMTQLLEPHAAVRVQCADGISADDLTMLTVEVCFLAKQHGCQKILVDLTGATLKFEPVELCALADIYAECHMPITTRSAIVLSPLHAPQDYAKLLHACREYGYSVEVFTGSTWAEAWLSAD